MIYLILLSSLGVGIWWFRRRLLREKTSMPQWLPWLVGGISAVLLFMPNMIFLFFRLIFKFLLFKKWSIITLLFQKLLFKSSPFRKESILFESDALIFCQNPSGSVRCYDKLRQSYLNLSNINHLQEIYQNLNSTERYYWFIWVANLNPSACQYFAPFEGSASNEAMSISEAMDILSLEELLSEEEVKAHYKSAIQKHHPDKGGNAYFARKIVAAKEYLLSELRKKA